MNRHYLYSLVLIFSFVIGCKKNEYLDQNTTGFPFKTTNKLDSLNRPLELDAFYFPQVTFKYYSSEIYPKMDSIVTSVLSKTLYNLNEPILSTKYLGYETYRIVLWNELPIKTIRIIKEHDSVLFVIKYAKNYDLFNPGIIDRVIHKKFSVKIWDTLISKINNTLIWNAPKYNPHIDYSQSACYILEGHKKNKYSILAKWEISKEVNLKQFEELLVYIEKLESTIDSEKTNNHHQL